MVRQSKEQQKLSAKEFRSLGTATRGNKFGAKRETGDGLTFDSRKEFRRYAELKLAERAGDIQSLRVHPKFEFAINGRPLLIRSVGYPNGRRVSFKPDFEYFRPGVGLIIEDVKGGKATQTESYKLRKAIFECLNYPARVEEV